MKPHPYCLAAVVSAKALAVILENGGRGAYRDQHPWLLARTLLHAALDRGEFVPLLLASGTPLELTHWGVVEEIDVEELHKGAWESRCNFVDLREVSPLFTPLDSVMLKPGEDELLRERLEGVAPWRHALDERHIHPYAICETPAFIGVATAVGEKESSEK